MINTRSGAKQPNFRPDVEQHVQPESKMALYMYRKQYLIPHRMSHAHQEFLISALYSGSSYENLAESYYLQDYGGVTYKTRVAPSAGVEEENMVLMKNSLVEPTNDYILKPLTIPETRHAVILASLGGDGYVDESLTAISIYVLLVSRQRHFTP